MKRSLAFWIALTCFFPFTFAQTYTTYTSFATPIPNPGGTCWDFPVTSRNAVWADAGYTLNTFQTTSLNFDFELFLGEFDGGGNGIAFLFQQEGPNAFGASNWAIGYGGGNPVSPSVAVEIDTRFEGFVDPAAAAGADHMSVYVNGANNAAPAAGPTNLPNVENDGYHRLVITWNHLTETMTATFDDIYVVSYTFDPATIFSPTGGPIYYGFTSSSLYGTAAPVNNHRVSFDGPGSLNACSAVISLPVELLDFLGDYKQDHVELNWLTATEINNDYFEVQRSVDGKNWEALGNVAGSGTSTEMNNYEYKDYLVSYGTNFYRLKQVDFDGTFSYSNRIEVELPLELARISLFPNPVSEELQVRLLTEGPLSETMYTVFDMTGRIVMNSGYIKVDAWKPEFTVPVSELEPGIYIIDVAVGEDFVKTAKFVVK
ncbi:MAG: T9SS type A sorting domain-containing protein [Bacteroidota bacterium]